MCLPNESEFRRTPYRCTWLDQFHHRILLRYMFQLKNHP
jgi:hypothetical protein